MMCERGRGRAKALDLISPNLSPTLASKCSHHPSSLTTDQPCEYGCSLDSESSDHGNSHPLSVSEGVMDYFCDLKPSVCSLS
jgi:hypothetical protein